MKKIILIQLICLLFIALFIQSCDKTENIENNGDFAKFRFNMNSIADFANSNTKSRPNQILQQDSIPLGNGLDLISTISEDNGSETRTATALKNGIKYRMTVYSGSHVSGNAVLSEEFAVGSSSPNDFVLDGNRQYTFVFHSFNNTKCQPVPDDYTFVGVSGDTDLLYHSETRSFGMGSNPEANPSTNIMDVSFTHKFSQMKIIFESANETEIGNITALGDITFNSHFTLSDFNIASNAITYCGTEIKKTFSFPSLYAPSVESEYVRLNTNTQTGTVHVGSITTSKGGTVANIPDRIGIKIEPGKSYKIIYTLKKSSDNSKRGFEVGNLVWSSGNLVCNNGVYGFATTQGVYGDYWYREYNSNGTPLDSWYLTPRTDGQTIGSGNVGDPCSKVGSGWRMPSEAEFLALYTYSNWYGNPSNKFSAGSYLNTHKGVWFGTGVKPSDTQKDDFLFLPFAGCYNWKNPDTIGNAGYYWHLKGKGTDTQLAEYYMTYDNNGGLSKERANSIRCVKDK